MKLRPKTIAFALCLTATPLWADWKSEIGFTRLQSLADGSLPSAPGAGLTQVEAPSAGNYTPDVNSALFNGKTLIKKSGLSATSNHAQHVATNFYATSSLIPGACDVDLYEANDWLDSGFLNFGGSVPNIETRAVQNHSWIGSFDSDSFDTEVNQRLDFAIDRDGFVCVVGENNVNSTTLPQLLGQSYHTVSVGRDDGTHTAGFTTFDGTGRIKPDIVAPSTAPESATSWTTPMVAGAAGLLYAKLTDAPYSLTGADRPRAIKALLLASATKNTVPDWDNTATRPLDDRYGAGELNIHHAYQTLIAGRAFADNTQHGISGWAAEAVDGTAKTYYLTIPPGAPSTPFCAALTWHRSINSNTWTGSLANLRLRLHHATGTTTGSQIAESDSTADNVELIYQENLSPGDYAVVVSRTSNGGATPYALAWHSLPAAAIVTTTPDAREIDGQPGLVTIARGGDLTLPLYVPLTIGGSAIPGTHYQALPASVTIPAGQSSADLQIIPVSDSFAQGDRTVTITVAEDFALVSDPGQSGLVTIQDKPFDAWRYAAFTAPELASLAISGESADPDGDQLSNLIEYALGLAPKSPDTSPVAMIDSGGYLALSTAKNPAATDITWAAQVTADLTNWNPAVILTDTPDTFEARDTVLKNDTSKRFIRLKIGK